MTPTEQEKELREKLTKLISQDGWVDIQEVDVDGQVNELFAIITADRKRVALEARIDELGSVQLEYNHLLAQTFRDGQAMTVQKRYDYLQAQLTTNKSKDEDQ